MGEPVRRPGATRARFWSICAASSDGSSWRCTVGGMGGGAFGVDGLSGEGAPLFCTGQAASSGTGCTVGGSSGTAVSSDVVIFWGTAVGGCGSGVAAWRCTGAAGAALSAACFCRWRCTIVCSRRQLASSSFTLSSGAAVGTGDAGVGAVGCGTAVGGELILWIPGWTGTAGLGCAAAAGVGAGETAVGKSGKSVGFGAAISAAGA